MSDGILQVALAAPLDTLFDYLPPADRAAATIAPGTRVRVPFGRRQTCGLVMGAATVSTLAPERLRRISLVLDDAPLLDTQDLALLRWAAAYYHHPIGEVVLAALPARLRRGEPALPHGVPAWRLTAAGREVTLDSLRRAPRQRALLARLQAAAGWLPQASLYAELGECRAVLRRLRERGWLESGTQPLAPAASPPDRDAAAAADEAPAPAVPAATALATTHAALTGAQPAQPATSTTTPATPPDASPPTPNAEQAAAITALCDGLGHFGVFLLQGVTGSGKTEVYLQAASAALAQGRAVLVLAPEIALTPQLVARFRQRLTAPVEVLHSALNDTEREAAWQRARRGEARVVIGTRSAILGPLRDLGLIVVDEEHDGSFKQQDGWRYSARDLAVKRARLLGCPVVLGSATPALETLHNAARGRYRQLQLRTRAAGAGSPRLQLLDVRGLPPQQALAPVLLERMRAVLAAGEQVIVFLNRRGYAPVLCCFACGWLSDCPRCDARQTLHAAAQRLWCHHCGAQRPAPPRCPACGAAELHPLGHGTQRLEQALTAAFPEHPLVRIDRDATRRRGSLEHLLDGVRRGATPLLIGTQMLAKGHHFPAVTLVAMVDIDGGLFSADYRAGERMAQLIVQVAGRAGRGERPGQVVVQTRYPEHPLLQSLLRHGPQAGYAAFAQVALAERQAAALPPYSHQALLRAEAGEAAAAEAFLAAAADCLAQAPQPGVAVWGPVPAPMERRGGRHRAQLLLQADHRAPLHRALHGLLPALRALPSVRKVRWSLDIDPQDMY